MCVGVVWLLLWGGGWVGGCGGEGTCAWCYRVQQLKKNEEKKSEKKMKKKMNKKEKEKKINPQGSVAARKIQGAWQYLDQ